MPIEQSCAQQRDSGQGWISAIPWYSSENEGSRVQKQSSPSATVRPVRCQGEIARIASLADEIWHQHFTPIIGQAQVDYMLKKFQSPASISRQIAAAAEYYGLFSGANPAGYFCLVPEPDAGKLLISKLYVRQAARGHGLGRQALDFIETRARELGLHVLRLTVNKHNSHTIAWYHHVGFAITGTQVEDIGNGFVMDDYLMEKALY